MGAAPLSLSSPLSSQLKARRILSPPLVGRWLLHDVRPRRIRGGGRAPTPRIKAVVADVGAPNVVAPVQITWQIAVGALAGVTPFVGAGIEFGKRILAQRRCEVCGGSGLVLKEDKYARCPGCGGFLPWQSWKRFFTG